uniref:Uncharacterized protein n=1 Tax=Tanacetum cinerariifolium TaxID=118510 RepID=A0A699KB42_TANCI|nr:hypothetical protein CTI12_AA010250 [Tanacetum cinerariifolium]
MASNYNFDPVLDKAILFAVGNNLVCDDHEEAKIVIETLSIGKLHRLYKALYSSVKLHLMLNSKRLTDGDGERDLIITTSLLEASNLLVLKGGSVIQSNSNLLVHLQVSLNLTMADIVIEARHLFYQYFVVSINYNFDPVLDKAILFAVGNNLVCDDHEEAKIVIETLSIGKLHRVQVNIALSTM